jgi:hypothetical protein
MSFMDSLQKQYNASRLQVQYWGNIEPIFFRIRMEPH